MSSTISTQQPADPYKEKNLDNPPLSEKVTDLVDFVDKHKFCMMTTRDQSTGLLVSRCMALAAREPADATAGLDMLFHSNAESGKTSDLEGDAHVNLAFVTPAGEWASVSGLASVESDREVVRRHYSPGLKAWIGDLGDGTHDGGPDDPRIVVIRVKTQTAQYAVSRKGVVGSSVEFAKAMAKGDAPAVNKLRQISEEEVQQWRQGQS
ncbi:hypothetical protein BDY21DRAFT_373387 [Lineolata rhizophorae]|uniref:General stress protein FMN-binding split barrel domain-containing protein n=1 Tax=Lineolata rhizophorae TaxID=578093 RepID=A0A6A6NUM5_9PEZI|nr:hypothetical protein BDY21DRAFT_373387 [Lineolata rhizophorae]